MFFSHLYKSKISHKTYTIEINFFKKYEASYLCKSGFSMESPWLNPQKYFSHLVAIGNIKIKRGKQNIPYIKALEKAKPPPIFKKYHTQAKRKSRYRGVVITL